jgi:hypothetical protein
MVPRITIHIYQLACILQAPARRRTIAEGASGVETAVNLDDMVRILEAARAVGKILGMSELRGQARSGLDANVRRSMQSDRYKPKRGVVYNT